MISPARSSSMRSAAGWRWRRCCALGARTGRYGPNGRPFPPSSIPWLGARHLAALHRLVRLQRDVGAIDGRRLGPRGAQLADGHGRRHRRRGASLSKADPGFVHNGALAGLVAVCAGSDVMHPIGALVVGGVAGAIFVGLHLHAGAAQDRRRARRLAAARPLRPLGRHRLRHLRARSAGRHGRRLADRPARRLGRRSRPMRWPRASILYAIIKRIVGIRLTDEQQRRGADLSIHSIGASPEEF